MHWPLNRRWDPSTWRRREDLEGDTAQARMWLCQSDRLVRWAL